ncbi:MAG TPA: patatin-like phospholipase family protein [Polyangiaceae bacterium]|nr:patatin-like phospholipase family protein [Polyangiaceae bacterium]
MSAESRLQTALVLSGGGARGAYQVGALRALSEMLSNARELPFPILAGASAGSITNAFLAAHADDFSGVTQLLVDFWAHIRPHDVFRTDTSTLLRVAAEWAADLSLGGRTGAGRERSLLLTDPLRALLAERLDMDAVRRNVERGLVRGIALTATNYRTNLAVTFFDGAESIRPWGRSTRIGMRDRLTIDHVMASSAIPIFFPAIRIGGKYFADGCVRLTTPLSPAIHLGAERILAIGVRSPECPDRKEAAPSGGDEPYPTVAETAGLLLNALFLEALESDVERFERINHTVTLVPAAVMDQEALPLRPIPLLVLRPSCELGALAVGALEQLPHIVQHLFRGLGATAQTGADLLSYLAFDGEYTSKLLALGYSDTLARKDELLEFFR